MNLVIQISEKDFRKLRFRSEKVSFREFMEAVKTELAKDALKKSVELAEKYGLSEMTDAEINAEIQAVRNAKNRS